MAAFYTGSDVCFRLPREPDPDHGEADPGPVRAVQAGRVEGRPGGGHQQEAVARDHQGPQPPLLHHQRRLHPQNTVRIVHSSTGCPCNHEVSRGGHNNVVRLHRSFC